MTDPIADMLTRVRNALASNKQEVSVPFSSFKLAIANLLKQEGWIEKVETVDVPSSKKTSSAMFKEINITLKYDKSGKPVINSITRVSKPGRRIYKQGKDIKKVKNGYGMSIVSTSDGVMPGGKAYSQGKGGEMICKIW